MNNTVFSNTVRFVLLVVIQVLICNTLNFLGDINPMIYVIFLYWYPIKSNRALTMVIAFLLGFTIDVFSDTLALHAFATVTVAYARPVFLRLALGTTYDPKSFSFATTTTSQRITFLGFLVAFHHLVFFSLEILSISHFLLLLKKVVTTSSTTWILCLLFSSLFSPKRE